MKTLYNNKLFTIQQSEHGAYYIANNRTGYSTSATVYDDNTIGYDWPHVMTKASRRALYKHIERTTGKPVMQWASPVHRDLGLVKAEI